MDGGYKKFCLWRMLSHNGLHYQLFTSGLSGSSLWHIKILYPLDICRYVLLIHLGQFSCIVVVWQNAAWVPKLVMNLYTKTGWRVMNKFYFCVFSSSFFLVLFEFWNCKTCWEGRREKLSSKRRRAAYRKHWDTSIQFSWSVNLVIGTVMHVESPFLCL